ncbi:N-acetyltransferase [Aureimonas sp. AU22]|uniref:GNAT family N-acetyltransferase n=1 Tax=Aureimonas sp. AU22 TaxID=1638162 RepID=UPI0007835265|nr:GNAT family N-acetyltransferase [Aureimonas sp. AU22]
MSETTRFTPIGRGKIAAIATTLEMRAAAPPRPVPAGIDGEIVSLRDISADDYLDLFRRVGQDYLWLTRLVMSREDLETLLASPDAQIFGERVDGRLEGLLELDWSAGDGTCEIKYFGVTRGRQATGAARRLMNHAIEAAFGAGATRLWLHTNTMDHPRALAFYARSGFEPVRQEVEINDDPRLAGLLPRDAAPHVPIFE